MTALELTIAIGFGAMLLLLVLARRKPSGQRGAEASGTAFVAGDSSTYSYTDGSACNELGADSGSDSGSCDSGGDGGGGGGD